MLKRKQIECQTKEQTLSLMGSHISRRYDASTDFFVRQRDTVIRASRGLRVLGMCALGKLARRHVEGSASDRIGTWQKVPGRRSVCSKSKPAMCGLRRARMRPCRRSPSGEPGSKHQPQRGPFAFVSDCFQCEVKANAGSIAPIKASRSSDGFRR